MGRGEQSHREHRGAIPLDGRGLGIVSGLCLQRLGDAVIIKRIRLLTRVIGFTIGEQHDRPGGSGLGIIPELCVGGYESFILTGPGIQSD